MYAITVIASPRRNGNCKHITDTINNVLGDNDIKTETYFIDDLNINPCQACRRCKDMDNPTRCIIDDDFNRIMDRIRQSQLFIFAAPNYFGELNAQAHLFIDRFYSMTKTTPNKLDYTTKCIVIHTYGARMGHYDEYINKRARVFNSIGLDVIEVLSIGGGLPTSGDDDEVNKMTIDAANKAIRSIYDE